MPILSARETTTTDPALEPKLPRKIGGKLDRLWEQFDALKQPTVAQMDEFLGELLALPSEATSWSDPLHKLAQHNHPDLPAVFRRIADAVPHTKETGMAFFYWAAAEEFFAKDLGRLMPEVVAGFCKLDLHSYDADALVHLEDYLLAGHFEAEALLLAEHFLPIKRADRGLMPYAVFDTCKLIFELRVGRCLRSDSGAGTSAETLAQTLRRDIEEDIDVDVSRHAAAVVCEPLHCSSPIRAHFELAASDTEDSDLARQDWLRLYGMLICVVREALQLAAGRFAPGCAFRGLCLLLESVYSAREDTRAKRKRTLQGGNLLDYLHPSGIDGRIARTCRDLLGVNVPRARLLLGAHEMLLHFATRHRLISAGDAAATQSELTRLQCVLGN